MQSKPQRWDSRPGSYDVLHTDRLFPSDNAYGIPTLNPVPQSRCPRWLVPYGQRVRSQVGVDDGAVHFFLDDYRFETVWSRPRKALKYLQKYNTLLTPDFSLFRGEPLAMQLWNTYRSRWCGAYWTSLGFTVIPTVSWSTPESYDFCFCGLPSYSLLAVSTVGTHKDPSDRAHFMSGFDAMLERLQPTRVLCYGDPYPEMLEMVMVVEYPAFWQGVRRARNRKQQPNRGD